MGVVEEEVRGGSLYKVYFLTFGKIYSFYGVQTKEKSGTLIEIGRVKTEL